MPKRYYHQGTFHEDVRISGAVLKRNDPDRGERLSCLCDCLRRVVRLEDGENAKAREYETLVGFGPNLLLNDPVLATRLGELCDRYGMDSISMSNTIGLAFQLYEMGVITSRDTDGLELVWGNASVVEPLVHKTANARVSRLPGRRRPCARAAFRRGRGSRPGKRLEVAITTRAAPPGWRWYTLPRRAAPATTSRITSSSTWGR